MYAIATRLVLMLHILLCTGPSQEVSAHVKVHACICMHVYIWLALECMQLIACVYSSLVKVYSIGLSI